MTRGSGRFVRPSRRVHGALPARRAPRKAAAHGAPGCAVPISSVCAFARCRGRRLRAHADASAEELFDSAAHPAEHDIPLTTAECAAERRPPIPLEGGSERAPEHNAGGLCEPGCRQACGYRPHNPRYVQVPAAACASAHAVRCGVRRGSFFPRPPPAVRASLARCAPPRCPQWGLPKRRAAARAAAAEEEQHPRQSPKTALVTGAADPMSATVIRCSSASPVDEGRGSASPSSTGERRWKTQRSESSSLTPL